MPNSWINHVSIQAEDFEVSRQFYEDLFGAVVVRAPNMGAPVYWFKMGDLQLHFYPTVKPSGAPMTESRPTYQHFAVGLDDFAEFYYLARERDVPEDSSIWDYPLNVLPSGQVQYYVRDPSGNLIEVNCEDATTLPQDILDRANFLGERFQQSEEQKKAELFLEQTKPASAGAQ